MTTSTKVEGGRRRARLALYALSTALTSCGTLPALAQTAPPAPVRQSIDANGVDLFSGTYRLTTPGASMGADQGATYNWQWIGAGWLDSLDLRISSSGSEVVVSLGGASDRFTVSGGVYTNTEGNGATLTYNGTTKIYTYTRSDGSVIRFDKNLAETGTYYNEGLAADMTAPSGKRLTFSYESAVYCKREKVLADDIICLEEAYARRLAYATSNFGYRLTPSYVTDALNYFAPLNIIDWKTRKGGSVTNLAMSPSVTTSFSAVVTASGGFSYLTLTDPMSRVTQYRTNGPQLLGIKRPGSGSEDVTIAYASGKVSSVTSAAGTTSYAYSDAGGVRTVTVTDPASHATIYAFDIASQRMTSMTNALSQTTSWQYDASGRVTRITQPEGNYTQLTYDGRGNVTERREVAKSGSGVADIVTTASYDASCTNPVTCNQPNSTTDPRGNTTDYSYDTTHGGVLTVTAPAPSTGATRPQARYGYTSLQAYYDQGSGIVASGVPVYRLTSVSQCRTGSSCAGTADEVKATIGYGPQSAGTGNNLLPVSASAGAGDGSLTATTATGYDAAGNAITVDGPLAGSADTTRYRYNADRELIGVTSPDPDGAGSLKPRATRLTRDGKGRVTLAEAGNVDSQGDGDWAAFSAAQAVETAYDGVDRKTLETLKSGGTAYAVTQYGYNAAGLAECVAVRMNGAAWGSLPASACSLGTTGGEGPDRITRTSYDNANRATLVQTAYGTADQADELTTSYNANGTVASVTDGNGNRTTYEYDGVDRLAKTRYPVTTTGSGTSSTTDYEQLGYDPAGNVTSRRLRDGQTITYGYDNLNRVTSKTTPGSVNGDWDVTYGYDLLGRMTNATGDGWAVNALGYDALGRLVTEQNYNATTTHAYDLAGRQTRLTWGDGFYVDYDYTVTGEVTAIRENGASSGAGVLASYGYDQLGRRTSVTRGNGTATSYGYDNVSRLASLTQDLAGSAYDFTHGFSYNAASQIKSLTRSNDAYAWNGAANAAKAYTVNGLNQATAAAGTSIGYDGRGNTASVGAASYGYTTENRLASAPGATMLYEPGGGQLLQFYNTGTGQDTRFAWSGGQMIAEINASNWTITRRYVPGPGLDEPIVWYEGSGTSDRRWLHADERGSVVAVSDGSGAAIGVNSYDEYGVPGSGNIGRFGYTGQAWLPEIGMSYYKARIYAPTLGRFLQTDPIGYGDGINWYNYVGGDPVNGVDPSGFSQNSPSGCSTLTDFCRVVYFGSDGDVGYWIPREGSTEPAGEDEIVSTGQWKWVSAGQFGGLNLSGFNGWSGQDHSQDRTIDMSGLEGSGVNLAEKPAEDKRKPLEKAKAKIRDFIKRIQNCSPPSSSQCRDLMKAYQKYLNSAEGRLARAEALNRNVKVSMCAAGIIGGAMRGGMVGAASSAAGCATGAAAEWALNGGMDPITD